MLWAYTEWFPKLILPHLYQKAAGRAEQQQPVAVRDPYRAPKRQNPAPCSAQLPRTSTPSPQPMGHNVDPQNAQSSLSPTHTHAPSDILCLWKNTVGAASLQGTFGSHKPTASCGLHYKRGLIPLVADPTANSTCQGKPWVKSLQLTLAEVTQCTPKHRHN